MKEKNQIGTILRCPNVSERLVSFYHDIGLNAVQISCVFEPWLGADAQSVSAAKEIYSLLQKYGISIPTMFLSFPDQDWSRPEECVGLTPLATRGERTAIACRQMLWGKQFGVKYCTCHVGSFPDANSEMYKHLIEDLRQLARFAAFNGQYFLFETGMETAPSLTRILNNIGETNTGLNFDPANMLIYGLDTPENIIKELADKIKVIHCKDARAARNNEKWGAETVLGQGETHFSDLLACLLRNGFAGPLIIERELPPGPEQEKDISEAVSFINSIIANA